MGLELDSKDICGIGQFRITGTLGFRQGICLCVNSFKIQFSIEYKQGIKIRAMYTEMKLPCSLCTLSNAQLHGVWFPQSTIG